VISGHTKNIDEVCSVSSRRNEVWGYYWSHPEYLWGLFYMLFVYIWSCLVSLLNKDIATWCNATTLFNLVCLSITLSPSTYIYIYIHIYIYTHSLFITFGPSPGPANRSTDWANYAPLWPCTPGPIRTLIEPTWPRLTPHAHDTMRLSHFMHSLSHFAILSPIFWFWLVICYIVSRFAIVNSVILLQ
jgi:hypothetical protein